MYHLICQNLEFQYPQNPNFCLSIPELTCSLHYPLGIYGLTGSGKSTFGKILGGLLIPTKGCFRLENAEPTSSSDKTKPRILYLPQFPELIFLGMSIGNAWQKILKNWNNPVELTAKFADNLQKLGLDYNLIRERYGYELSSGELRLATIALGITFASQLTIFDEPTIALSPPGRAKFENILAEYNSQKEFMIISHDYRLLRKLCRNVLIFNLGSVIFNGEWKELDHNPSIIQQVGLNLLENLSQRNTINEQKPN
ncbi:MAG TPA: energy-coupling factor ABC transporter ATP-binding protein [Candidatus Marinimicrobia bacterium]|nr:energy-coupling factor ABC transporter ATP-binding protein [Candidatus Neomarinimicrobiota bacterium]HRS50929.1 energy-coupling factor ABC transporter ATP-binding protein [Candidatus Neomarinimicrobiota bacterium]HRU91729.1 energy-coupling factor ABC transporter ATP-binding protein [Candidatus Neomarinimicrobiota bacterium]